MQLGERIAEGGQAEIFALGAGRVVKLFRSGFDAVQAAEEARKTAVVAALGYPVPAVHDVVEIDGRHGFVQERLQGPTLFELTLGDPAGALARVADLAALHAHLHTLTSDELPRLEPRLAALLAESPFSASDRAAARACLDACPQGDAVYHGDFHPLNVLSTATGLRVIDWFGASRAHAAADVAQSCLVVRTAILPDSLPAELRRVVEAMRPALEAAYLDHYLELGRVSRDEVRAWMRPLAAARLRILQQNPFGEHDYEALRAIATGERVMI
jgi:aminoglycoside phosphotransferase (APT) family kinase protein